MRRSIRWELPLSYAAIALLTTVALGAVLLLILRGQYGRLEQAYLEGNALAFSYTLGPLLEDDLPAETLTAQVISLSFLSQARVRLLDVGGTMLADSTTPGRFQVALAAPPGTDVLVPAPDQVDLPARSFIAIDPARSQPEAEPLAPRLFRESDRWGDPFAPLLLRTLPFGDREVPLNLGGGAGLASFRSDRVVRQPIYNAASELLGYVELSEGPAYGRAIVASVARGWAVAGVVAAALAAAAGWLISRRISQPLLALTGATTRMAGGDLSARAAVSRRDEFGTLARSFNVMAARVEDTVVTLRRFVSDAAHELHTPLATLRANLEMMQAGPPAQAERLARAQAQVERLEILIRGMLDLSRLEAGVRQTALGPVSLTALAREMGELYASRAEHAGLGFALSLPDTPVFVRGDEQHLRQALANLLDNALKFTSAGGSVALGLDLEDDAATLWVEDTGIGIPNEDLPHLFQRFHRGRNTAGYPGSGLGLAIVRAIADEHGGQVTAEPLKEGSRLSLRLPRDS